MPLIEKPKERHVTPVIPPRRNRCYPRQISFLLCKKRNATKRFFARLKQFRGIVTPYNKLDTPSSQSSNVPPLSLELTGDTSYDRGEETDLQIKVLP